MNERIKILAKVAGYDEISKATLKLMGLDIEKFAKLIVRDCVDEIKALRENYDTHIDVYPEENDWYVDAFLQAEVRLKQQFGVEE